MYRLKRQQKRSAFFDILLIVLLNVLLWLYLGGKDLFSLLQAHQLDKYILVVFTLLLSLLYYSLRRWRESVTFSSLAERRASKDPLTKLYNRRALESKLLLEWQRFSRYKESFCLLMVHIDDLKVINNSFGYQEGDRVIIEVSEKILGNIRKTDFCARWSGSEFLVFCPVSELPQIVALAERLRADAYRLLEDGIELTISSGVGQAETYKSLDELLKKVEAQLHKAKTSGGNRVVSELQN